MAVYIVHFILFLWFNLSSAMLDQGIASTPKLSPDEAAYIHQILNQEAALRVELEKQIASLQSTVYSLQQEVLNVKKNLTSGSNKQDPGSCMFSAYLSTDIVNPHMDQVIKFDKTWLNTHNAYKTGSGIFTATLSGIYLISVTVASHQVNTHLQLVVNGKPIAAFIADIHHTGYYGRSSLTLLQHLNAQDNVWITSKDNGVGNKIIGGNVPLSFFSVYLLQ